MKKNKAKSNHYVNNADFCAAMVEFRSSVLQAKEQESSRPMVPNYIGECFIKIATHLSYKPNFINYTFRDDMIADGIENCLQYIDNFDPAKSNLEKHGLLPKQIGWSTENIHDQLDGIILGMHAKKDNPELLKAQELGLKIYSFPAFIYEYSKNKKKEENF